MSTQQGRPVQELTDEELEQQGKSAHETRKWVFLHGTAEQFATHTARMLALEQEYLRRYPQRTWQGTGGAASGNGDATAQLKVALIGIIGQLQALVEQQLPAVEHPNTPPGQDPVKTLLSKLSEQPDGRMNKLEMHQLARECGLSRGELASLYGGDDPVVATDKGDRVITDKGRAMVTG